jgi:hypothetical protein
MPCFRLGIHFKDDGFHFGQAEFPAGPPAPFSVNDSKPLAREPDRNGFSLSCFSNTFGQFVDGVQAVDATLVGLDGLDPDPFDFHGKALSSILPEA